MKINLGLISKNRVPAKSIFVDDSSMEEKPIFCFRRDAYAFFNFLGNPEDSELQVQICFSDDSLNAAQDQLVLERKFSKSYLLDLVSSRRINVSFGRLFASTNPFDELLNIAEEKLAKDTILHLAFNPPILEVSEVTDKSQVEIFFRLQNWEGGVMTNFKTIRDYVNLTNPEE
jgi:hypothetical protein